MFAAARKPEAIAASIAMLRQVDDAASGAGIDYTRGVHPVDAIVDQVKQDYLDRHAGRDPYPSQEFVTCLNTGRGFDGDKWHERQARDAVLFDQTETLAAALERTGISARGQSDVTAIGLITGAQESLSAFRPICFFPLVAQRKRRPMANELRYFRKTHQAHGKFMRYAVVTNGPRVPLVGLPPARLPGEPKTGPYYELRERISKLSRSISRFAQWARDTHDIDVVFRGIEFTVEQREGDDFLSAHPHANVLYTPRRKLKKRQWDAFLAGASEQFDGWWWKDCGKLLDPNEAIKYAFKPCELRGLDDAQVRWLYEQTFGLPIAQPMGAFKQWRSDTLWTIDKGADGKARPRQHRKVFTAEYSSGSRLEICSIRKRIGKRPDPSKIVRPDQAPLENLLMCITLPQRRNSPYAEPCVLVLNYTREPASEWGQETLDTIAAEREKLLPVWYMNGAPDPDVALALGRGQAAAREGEAGKVVPFSVHTRTSTAVGKSYPRSAQGPPPAISPTAGAEWLQLGVDFSTG